MATDPTILWVDDDAQFVQDVLAVWHPSGNVMNVSTCGEARSRLADFCPALVILDLNVPDPGAPAICEGGLRLLEYIRRECERDTPVLVLTGEERPAVLSRAVGLGAYAVLPKRNAISEIAEVVAQKL